METVLDGVLAPVNAAFMAKINGILRPQLMGLLTVLLALPILFYKTTAAVYERELLQQHRTLGRIMEGLLPARIVSR